MPLSNANMKKPFEKLAKLAVLALVAVSCATTPGIGGGHPLQGVIEQSAESIATDLSAGTRVAIVAFESENDNLSDFIMEELTGALVGRGIEVADRQNLPYVFQELNFQMSGNVSDDTAKSVGQFVAAELVITGQLYDLGGTRQLSFNAINVETALRESVPRFGVPNDKAMQGMVVALGRQEMSQRVHRYGVSEDTTPKTAGTFLDRGIMFAMRGEYDKAILDFDEAIRIDPNLTAAYMLRGRALFASTVEVIGVDNDFSGVTNIHAEGRLTVEQTNTINRAIEDFSQAIRLDPNNTNAYGERAGAFSTIGEYARAIADFDQAIRLSPNNTGVLNNRGVTYKTMGNLDLAIADYNEAIRLDPNYASAFGNRGNAYYDMGNLDLAIADFTQAIRLEPNYAVAFVNCGNIHDEKGNYDLAIADYNEAIRLDPNYASAFGNRGVAHLNKGNLDFAIADFTQAIRLNPNDATVFINRGLTHEGKGNLELALADYTQAIRIDPNYAMAFAYRGYVHRTMGNLDLAIADYTQAIRLDPNHALAFNSRGVAYAINGNLDLAIADFEAALMIDPNDQDARNNLERARQQRGR